MTDLEKVQKDPFYIQHIENPSKEICLAAIKQNGLTLRIIKEQTPKICLEAVKQDGYTLQYVKHQTPEICLEAIKQKGFALYYVTILHKFNIEQIKSIHKKVQVYFPKLKNKSPEQILKHFKKKVI